MLVTMKEILDRADRENYGVAAPIVSMELDARAALEAAEMCEAPVILGIIYQSNPDIVLFGSYLTKLAEQASVPVAINLDHGAEFAHAITAIKAGFTSIMADRSTLEYEENIAQVSELVKIAHAVDVSVEAELGHVGLGSDYNPAGAGLTDPEQALDFIKRTGIDCLAVAVGTAHGAYKGTPKIDFDRLVKIKELTKFPLVMHGGSGSGDDNLRKSCQLGINKVNVANDLFQSAYTNLLKTDMTGNGVYSIWEACKAGYKARLVELIDCFGSKGKSWMPEKRGLIHKKIELEEK
jgi:fructose-bisphosphate aldolase class II